MVRKELSTCSTVSSDTDGGLPTATGLPTLLGRGRRGSLRSEPCVVQVKNTFIDCFAIDTEDLDTAPPLVRQTSCPGRVGDDEEDAGRGAGQPSEWLMVVEVPAAAAAPPTSAEAQEVTDALPQHEIVPLPSRRPSMSLGSSDHGTGSCRPCAWFWRTQGCTNGAICRHCHLCPPGEVKARRKMRLASQRLELERLELEGRGGAGPAPDAGATPPILRVSEHL